MKKILFLTMITVLCALALAGCNKEISEKDYECKISYIVENKTDKTITTGIQQIGDELKELSDKVTIKPGEKKEIYLYSEMCNENTVIHNSPDTPLLLSFFNFSIYADSQKLNEEILNKKYWAFTAEKHYRATYLLVLTDDLLERIGYVD